MIRKVLVGLSFLLPVFAFAQQGPDATYGPIGIMLQNTMKFIDTILVPLIFALSFVMFIWGMFRYFIFGGANEDSRVLGKQLMIWSVVAFVLMVSIWGIVNVLSASFGLNTTTLEIRPSAIIK